MPEPHCAAVLIVKINAFEYATPTVALLGKHRNGHLRAILFQEQWRWKCHGTAHIDGGLIIVWALSSVLKNSPSPLEGTLPCSLFRVLERTLHQKALMPGIIASQFPLAETALLV